MNHLPEKLTIAFNASIRRALLFPLLVAGLAGAETPNEAKTFSASKTIPLANSDFERSSSHRTYGKEAFPTLWTEWKSAGAKGAMEIDDTVARSGRNSLRITSLQGADHRIIACSPNLVCETGRRLRISFWSRKDARVSEKAIIFRIGWLGATGGIAGNSEPLKLSRWHDGDLSHDWTQYSALFLTSKTIKVGQLLLGLDGAEGRIWFDNITVEDLGAAEAVQPDVWTYEKVSRDFTTGPLTRFNNHKTSNDRWYQAGARYNSLVFASGSVERDLRDLQRCLGYTRKPADLALTRRFEDCDRMLNDAYTAYIKAYQSSNGQDFDGFSAAADRLPSALDELRRDIAAALQTARAAAPATLPPELGRQPRDVKPFEPGGRMNRLLCGYTSLWEFSEYCKPLDLMDFHAPQEFMPKSHTGTAIDFSNWTKICDDLQKLGHAGTFGNVYFGLHGCTFWTPKWFLEKYKSDPDFISTSPDGLTGNPIGNRYALNYFHPAVREYLGNYTREFAAFCRNEPRMLFYFGAGWEAYGPFIQTSKGFRETGYGQHAETAFRQWLETRYRNIAALNHEWGSDYAGFADIVPPPDAFIGRPAITPLVAEFEAFRDDTYIGLLKLIYDSFKAGDPTKPVVHGHLAYALLDGSVSGARVFETCDLLSSHAPPEKVNTIGHAGNIYLNSLNRYAKKSLSMMEDTAGAPDMVDERNQRRQMESHFSRLCIWGRTLQMRWYAFTPNDYCVNQWFDPLCDLTTVRYFVPGMVVAKQQMEKLDWVLTHSQIEPAKALVLLPSATMRNQRPDKAVFSAILDLHGMLYDKGALYELLPEEYFLDKRASLDDYNVVILPRAKYLAADLQRRLLEFARRPGHLLILVGENGTFDELARPSGALLDGLGLRAADQPLSRGLRMSKLGEGEVCMIPDLLALEEDLSKLVIKHAPCPLQGDPRTENVLRVAENGDRYLFILNPNIEKGVETSVWLKGAVRQAVDVTAPEGFSVPVELKGDTSALKVRLGPGETAVIWIGKNKGTDTLDREK